MTWKRLDEQLALWSDRLISEIKISEAESRKLATTIASDIRFLPVDVKLEIAAASPVALRDRLQELRAFQGFMDIVANSRVPPPEVVRAQVMIQNYICFVYLPESCFSILSKNTPSGSVAKKCAEFLFADRIRAFRNAIAHANWTLRTDIGAITYWASKTGPKGPLSKFEVEQHELDFWQALSRCVAYAALSNLE